MQSTGHSAAADKSVLAGGSAHSGAMKTLLTGSENGQMNLRLVKEKGIALRKSIDDFIDLLQYQPHLLNWEGCLERFGVMGVRHQQLVEQLVPLLKFYVAYPTSVNQANAEVIPLLLSTMRLPEMEALENHLLQDHETSATTKGLVYYEQLGSEVDKFNQVLTHLTRHQPGLQDSGILDPKGPVLRAMAAQLRNAVNDVGKPRESKPDVSAGSSALLAAAMRGEGL